MQHPSCVLPHPSQARIESLASEVTSLGAERTRLTASVAALQDDLRTAREARARVEDALSTLQSAIGAERQKMQARERAGRVPTRRDQWEGKWRRRGKKKQAGRHEEDVQRSLIAIARRTVFLSHWLGGPASTARAERGGSART